MRRFVLLAALAAGLTAPPPALAQAEQQALVDRATLAVQEVMLSDRPTEAARLLRRARAVMVCPRVFRAGFIFGGEGGDCVLVARDGAGSWSSPAFYGLGSGSVGLQIGVQDAQVMMLIMNDRALNALMDSQFKLGADASVAAAHLGHGIEGSTTAAAGGDIVTFARTRGLFAGLTLEGSILTQRSAWNRAYYGREVSPRQIVIGMEVHNPGADPLRGVLLRFGSGQPAAALPPPAAAGPPGYAPPGYAPQGSAPPGYGQPGYAPPAYSQPGYAPPGYAPPGYAPPQGYAPQPGMGAGPAMPGTVQREALPPPGVTR